jgi:hypothetical protein
MDWTVRLSAGQDICRCEPFWDTARCSQPNGAWRDLIPTTWHEVSHRVTPIRAGCVENDINPLLIEGVPVAIAADDDRLWMKVWPVPQCEVVIDCTPPWARSS